MTNTQTINGIPVVVCQPYIFQNQRLAHDVPVTGSVRDDMNEWLKIYFGVAEIDLVEDGEVYERCDGDNISFIINQRTHAEFTKNKFFD